MYPMKCVENSPKQLEFQARMPKVNRLSLIFFAHT